MSEPLSLDENLFMLRGVIGDLRRGFSRAVDTERWVSDTQAFIDRIREQAQRVNVSAATRGDAVVAEGVTAGETALQLAWQPIATAPKDVTVVANARAYLSEVRPSDWPSLESDGGSGGIEWRECEFFFAAHASRWSLRSPFEFVPVSYRTPIEGRRF